MINLLPQEQKALIYKEYRLRLLAVALMFVLALVVLADVLFTPSYILMVFRAQSYTKSELTGPDPIEVQKRKDLSAQITSDIQLVNALKSSTFIKPSEIISVILQDKSSDNSLSSISYTPGTAQSLSVTVHGIAKNRESLMNFVEKLRHEPSIANVNLPISNFTQDSNIGFSFDITGAAHP